MKLFVNYDYKSGFKTCKQSPHGTVRGGKGREHQFYLVQRMIYPRNSVLICWLHMGFICFAYYAKNMLISLKFWSIPAA
jgi:hypothetical protein